MPAGELRLVYLAPHQVDNVFRRVGPSGCLWWWGSPASQSVSASSGEGEGKRSKWIYTKDGLVSAKEGSSGSSLLEWSSDGDEGEGEQSQAAKGIAEAEVHAVSSDEEEEEEGEKEVGEVEEEEEEDAEVGTRSETSAGGKVQCVPTLYFERSKVTS
ncbi:histone H3.v1-like [Setaria italica]|uniref:histone H3.v1-like n=1 Tax=Setaria italica TaxID=4555 RepID=UPI000350B543|nr:histone H3.v1-like [Setaria italica]